MFKIAPESHHFIEKLKTEDLGLIEKLNYNEMFDEFKEGNYPGFIHYKGSLTTPPCTDIVNWFVYRKVLPIS